MSLPRVAIVGRPNVGKSSLFNWLARRMIAVVDTLAGTTRDRMFYLLHERDRFFEIIDTGGIGIVDSDDLSDQIEAQIQMGIDEASVIAFVVDAKQGVMPLDRHVAEILRQVDKPKFLIINKADSEHIDVETAEFFKLGFNDVILTSTMTGRNRDALIDRMVNYLPPPAADEDETGETMSKEAELKLAIVGRRNVGKSTFLNALANEERVIVSEVAGTTRDCIDVRFEVDGKTLIAIDTPGVRKKKSLANDVEFYGLVRAQRSIRRADVVLMFFNASDTISRVDKKLVEEILANYKPCIFVVNKWDLAEDAGMTMEKWGEYLMHQFASVRHAPIAFITAKDKRNIRKLVNLAQSIFKQMHMRVSTGPLNRIVQEAIRNNPLPIRQNRVPRIYFATQVAIQPPTIVLKVNDPVLFDVGWRRYLLGVLQQQLPFSEVPIKLYLRAKDDTTFRGSRPDADPDGEVELTREDVLEMDGYDASYAEPTEGAVKVTDSSELPEG